MHVEDHPQARSGQTHLAARAQWLLRLYPRAWRDRYGEEVAAVLAEHHITYWTMLDLLLGALDAHLHRDLLPGRLISMAHRLRSSEIAIFCAFVLFCVAWLPLRLVRDPLPIWRAATAAHPELLAMLTLLDLGGSIATLAVLVGGVPLVFTALTQAAKARQWGRLGLFAVPVLAVAVLIGYAFVAVPASVAHQPGGPGAPLTPLAVVLQLGFVVLLLGAVGGSAAAIAAALAHSELGAGILRFVLVPACVATVALALGLAGAMALTILIFVEAPQLSSWPPLHVGDLLLMLAAVVLAGAALRQGIGAARAASDAMEGPTR
jgi:hypothetical protein